MLEAYVAQKGYLLKLIEHVPLSTLADLDRFQKIIQDAIDAGTVPLIKPFPKINKKELAKMQREMEQEAKEAEEIASRDTGDMESLKKAIQRQSQQRSEALISRLEEQYVNDEDDSKASKKRNQKKRKAASTAEPTEEEFMALQAKLFDKPKKATR